MGLGVVGAGIVGDGPAGKLAALVAHRAGLSVRLFQGGPGTPQERHIHVLRDGVAADLSGLDALLATSLADQTDPGHRWIGPDGTARLAPRLTRAGLIAALDTALAGAAIAVEPGEAETLPPGTATMWIDATGGARALVRAFEARGMGRLSLDDMGEIAVWQTRVWDEGLPDAPFTLVLPGRLYVETHPGLTRATGPLGPEPALPAGYSLPPGPPAASWRMAGPPVRLARWQGAGVVLFGDARLQTPPAMGFGLMALARQAVILSQALRDGDDPEPALADWAENTWMAAGLQAGLSALAQTEGEAGTDAALAP